MRTFRLHRSGRQARVRELAQPALDEYVADQIDEATLKQRKAAAREKATAEHAPLTELERASAEYMQAVSARTKAEAALSTSEAAEDAAESKLAAAKFADKFRRSSHLKVGRLHNGTSDQIGYPIWSDELGYPIWSDEL